jgi:hypothetical protein
MKEQESFKISGKDYFGNGNHCWTTVYKDPNNPESKEIRCGVYGRTKEEAEMVFSFFHPEIKKFWVLDISYKYDIDILLNNRLEILEPKEPISKKILKRKRTIKNISEKNGNVDKALEKIQRKKNRKSKKWAYLWHLYDYKGGISSILELKEKLHNLIEERGICPSYWEQMEEYLPNDKTLLDNVFQEIEKEKKLKPSLYQI